jgi:AcrR family transcriptional regulator
MDTLRDDTREQLLDAALTQFAARGFHGASIARIAGELGLTKQALLYYFRRKEDLYREVLRRIAERWTLAMQPAFEPGAPPDVQFENMMLGIYRAVSADPRDAAVVTYELLETQRRDAPPEEWYFRQFLDRVVQVLDEVEGLAEWSFARKFTSVFQILSAIQYFAISGATLRRFYGEEDHDRFSALHPVELRAQVRRLVEYGDSI